MLDLVIRGATIVDGTGKPGYAADVGIEAGRIALIGTVEAAAKSVLSGAGLVLAPGFIDIHTHAEIALLVDPRGESAVRQGVTTLIGGNCGSSPAPLVGELLEKEKRDLRKEWDLDLDWNDLDGFFSRLKDRGLGVHFGCLVGHGNLRASVMGHERRPPTTEEMGQMKALLGEAMRQGAMGISTGLIYPPSSFADTAEIVELAREAAKFGGFYASHIRGEGETVFEAVEEALEIGRRALIPVQISHLKLGRENWGRADELISKIEKARKEGPVDADQYPYPASSTGLDAILPDWVFEGGEEAALARLRDQGTRSRIRKEVEPRHEGWWDKILIADVWNPENQIWCGKTVLEMAESLDLPPIEAAFDLLLKEDTHVGAIFFSMKEEDVERIFSVPWIFTASDSAPRAIEGPLSRGKPHPRAYGTYPRVLSSFVREKHLLTLEQAIAKMTSLPAQKLGLADRGAIEEGCWADLVLFDPDIIHDEATFLDPHRYPAGIIHVFVNGQAVIEAGCHTGILQGTLLSGK
ncbi:MAG: D-aminoacylase [Armatimonadetes bacterium]|nr:D-aminoacylase [Armatimonadota bacterium]